MQPRIFVVKNFGRTTLLSRLIFVTALSFWPAVYGSYIGISSFNSLSMLEYKPINQSINLQELHPFNSLSTMEYKSINQPIILQELHRYTLPPLPCWNIFSYFLYILEIQKKPPSFIALLFGRKTVVLVIPVIRRYSITQSLTQSINQSINQPINQSTKIRQPEPSEHELTNLSIVHLADEVWSWEFVLQRLICWTNEEQSYVKVVAEFGVKLVLVRIINLILLQPNLDKLNFKIFFNGAIFFFNVDL